MADARRSRTACPRQRGELVEDLGGARGGKAPFQPISRRTGVKISASGSASPGGSTSFGRYVRRRSEFVITPSFSGHCAAGSSTSAKRGRLGRVVGVLHDHQLGLAQRLLDEIEIRHRRGRVGAHDPHAHRSRRQPLEDLERGQPGAGAISPGRHAPVALDSRAIVRVRDAAIARQKVREPAGLAPAHRVRLAGQREGPGAGPADLPGAQVQVEDRRVLVRADVALVDAHAPQRQRGARGAEAPRGGDDDLGATAR